MLALLTSISPIDNTSIAI